LSKKPYSPSQFGRDAEFIIALYLISKGWQVKLSKGSRGPADIMAKKDLILLYIQIKASSKLPRIKSSDIIKLKSKSDSEGALPVVATLQPFFQLSKQNEGKIITTTIATTTTTISTCTKSAIKKSINEKKEEEEEEKKIEFKIYFYNLSDWSKLDL
jgi:Holliday junction resolvase